MRKQLLVMSRQAMFLLRFLASPTSYKTCPSVLFVRCVTTDMDNTALQKSGYIFITLMIKQELRVVPLKNSAMTWGRKLQKNLTQKETHPFLGDHVIRGYNWGRILFNKSKKTAPSVLKGCVVWASHLEWLQYSSHSVLYPWRGESEAYLGNTGHEVGIDSGWDVKPSQCTIHTLIDACGQLLIGSNMSSGSNPGPRSCEASTLPLLYPCAISAVVFTFKYTISK